MSLVNGDNSEVEKSPPTDSVDSQTKGRRPSSLFQPAVAVALHPSPLASHLGLPPRNTFSSSSSIDRLGGGGGAAASPNVAAAPRGTPTTMRMSNMTPPGTKRTALFLSSVRPGMFEPPSGEGGSTVPANQTTPHTISGGVTFSSFDMAGSAGEGSTGALSSSSMPRRRDSFLQSSTCGVGGGGGSTTIGGERRSSAAQRGESPPPHTPTTSTPCSVAGRSFIVSKRQTNFLLSISTLYGASPVVGNDHGGSGGGNNAPMHRDASLGSLAADDAAASLVQGEEDKAPWRQLIFKQGDKARYRLVSLHADKHWGPLLVSTIFASFRERRPLMTIGGERIPADLVAECSELLPLEEDPTSSLGVSNLASLNLSPSNNNGRDALDTSPNKKMTNALAQSLSDAAAAKAHRQRAGAAGEVSYISKFSPDHDARVSASPQFSNAFYLDDPDIAGERRRKRMHLRSYVCTVISFADRRTEKKDINQQFFLRHPYLELRDIKLSHIRSIKTSLLQLCLEENSLIELSTIAYAAWYWERLVTALQVTKRNRKTMVAICVTLAIKFWEIGQIGRKIDYAWSKLESLFGVDPAHIKSAEFQVFVALEFTLLPPSFEVGNVYMERLLHIMNITMQEYYSKNFDQAIHWD